MKVIIEKDACSGCKTYPELYPEILRMDEMIE